MRFRDIDEREVGAVAEAPEEALDVARPATKRRSRVAAEDEEERPVPDERRKLDRLEIVGGRHGYRREEVSGPERECLRRAVPEEARDDRVPFAAGGEALDVRPILVVDDGGRGLVSRVAGHRAQDTDPSRWRHGVAMWVKVV